jgi:hypothetical protein
MPWFPDIEAGRVLARIYSESPRLSFYQGISERSPDELLPSFADGPRIDDPRHGHINTDDAFRRYVSEVREWVAQQQAIDHVALTVTRERSIEEVSIRRNVDQPKLPVVIVTDLAGDGRLVAVRVYYGLWHD